MARTPKAHELGVVSDTYPAREIRPDEFLPKLRGQQGIKKFREMRENDPVVGAILTAMDMMIRAVKWRVEGPEKGFIDDVLNDMEASFEQFITEVLSFLPYGFSVFEKVYVRRQSDGMIAIRKLAPRAQWTLEYFQTSKKGDIEGVHQQTAFQRTFIPANKMLHFRTVSTNNDPAGRSVLRNAHQPYHYLQSVQYYEAVAIERELNGLPVARVPSEYLSTDATTTQTAFINALKSMLINVKRNEQAYMIIPSDVYKDAEGKPSNIPMVDVNLIASKGTRDIDTTKVVIRYQQDIARSVMADFVMLGQNDRGSFALSKSKADLFLRALEGYVDSITTVINRDLIPDILSLNGKNPKGTMLKRGEIAPIDLGELGQYIQNLSNAGIPIVGDEEIDRHLRDRAGLPEGNPQLSDGSTDTEVGDDQDSQDGRTE